MFGLLAFILRKKIHHNYFWEWNQDSNPDLNFKADKLISRHHSVNMQHPFSQLNLVPSANPLRNQVCHSQISAVYSELTCDSADVPRSSACECERVQILKTRDSDQYSPLLKHWKGMAHSFVSVKTFGSIKLKCQSFIFHYLLVFTSRYVKWAHASHITNISGVATNSIKLIQSNTRQSISSVVKSF